MKPNVNIHLRAQAVARAKDPRIGGGAAYKMQRYGFITGVGWAMPTNRQFLEKLFCDLRKRP